MVWVSNDFFFEPGFDVLLDLMERSPALAWVQSSAAGTDLAWCHRLRQRGVRLTTSHVTGIPIAEYVMNAVLRATTSDQICGRAPAPGGHGSTVTSARSPRATWLVMRVRACMRI